LHDFAAGLVETDYRFAPLTVKTGNFVRF